MHVSFLSIMVCHITTDFVGDGGGLQYVAATPFLQPAALQGSTSPRMQTALDTCSDLSVSQTYRCSPDPSEPQT